MTTKTHVDGLSGEEEALALKELNKKYGWDYYATKKPNTPNMEHIAEVTSGDGLEYYEKRSK